MLKQFLFTFIVFTIAMAGFLLSLRFSRYKSHQAHKTEGDEDCGACGDDDCATCAVVSDNK